MLRYLTPLPNMPDDYTVGQLRTKTRELFTDMAALPQVIDCNEVEGEKGMMLAIYFDGDPEKDKVDVSAWEKMVATHVEQPVEPEPTIEDRIAALEAKTVAADALAAELVKRDPSLAEAIDAAADVVGLVNEHDTQGGN